jgi:hypothetical protein
LSTRARRNFLPNNYKIAHDLCFAVHDVLVQFLISGQQSGVFIAEVDLNDSEAKSIKSHGDIFEWLDSAGRVKDRAWRKVSMRSARRSTRRSMRSCQLPPTGLSRAAMFR